MICSTGSSSRRASSGSRPSISSVEPLMSAKSTVTCLRSPSRAAREARIFSARYVGVYTSGARSWSLAGADVVAVPPVQISTAPSSSTASFLAWIISALRSSRYSSSRSKRRFSARYDTRPSRRSSSSTWVKSSSNVIGNPPPSRAAPTTCTRSVASRSLSRRTGAQAMGVTLTSQCRHALRPVCYHEKQCMEKSHVVSEQVRSLMSTVELSPTTYQWLQRQAQESGRTPDQVADVLLRQHLAPQHAYIEVVEKITGSQAVLKGTRIPVSIIMGYLRAGETPASLV